jgi:hypothetical protein
VDDQHTPTNDLDSSVTKFCLSLERDRRTPEGRSRSEREFREHFFPYDDGIARDRILRFLPQDVRGPIIASWGIRGRKAAMRDDDPKVRAVVHDAFVAGDIDDQTFEDGLAPELIIGWVELADWWRFWRGGKHTKYSIQRALETAYDLELLDARWFLDTLESGGGKLHGTDVLVEGMSKTELADWIKKIHESGDGSPRGLLNALGWPTLVAKTSNAVLLSAMDAFAQKNGLVKDKFKADEGEPDGHRGSTPPSRPSGWSEGKSLSPKESPSSRDASASREAGTKSKEGTQKDVTPLDGPPRDDVELSPPNEALLRELETPSRPDEGDWLEDPVNVSPGEAVDDLDVVLTQPDQSDQPDPTDITQIFHREDDLFGPAPNGAEQLPESPAVSGPTRKAALPGLPTKRGKTVPPPLPSVDPPRPGRKG